MNKLHLAIYTGTDDENKVTLTANFASHLEAVKFNEDLAELCKQHSLPAATSAAWFKKAE